jgi:hypothetical protein
MPAYENRRTSSATNRNTWGSWTDAAPSPHRYD